MKALRSKLAADILADPVAREELRHYLVNSGSRRPVEREGANDRFVIRGQGGLQVEATVVPKAAKAA